MNIDFTKIDKKDFECIRNNQTGSVYFGQVMFIN